MIYRLSQKLARKLREAPSQVLPLHSNPYADWSCHLFTADRTQYIILTNTPSLYSAILFGAGNTDGSQFIRNTLDCIRESLVDDGQEFLYRKFIAPTTGTVRFSKALNRSVTGSMNDLIRCAKLWLVERGLSPFDTGFKLNDMPMSALDYKKQREVFKGLAVGECPSGNGGE